MINIFSKKYTDERKAVFNGVAFIVQQIDDTQAVKSSTVRQRDPVLSKMLWYMVAQAMKVVLGILGIVAIGMYQDSKSTRRLVFGVIGIIIAVVLHFYSKNKMQQYVYQDGLEECERINTSLQEARNAKLGIPSDAVHIEVMYLLHDPEGVAFHTYFNEPVEAFRETDKLYITTQNEKFAFPLSEISSIHEMKQEAALDSWNKDINFDEGMYVQYKMKSDASIYDQYYITTDYGRGVVIPNYYAIRIKDSYEILIPPYELDAVLELTGMQVS